MSSIILPPGVDNRPEPEENKNQPPEPIKIEVTDSHRVAVKSLVEKMKNELTSVEHCAALLEHPDLKMVVIHFMNLIIPGFLPQLISVDRTQIFNHILGAVQEQNLRYRALTQGPNLHEKTVNLLLGALKSVMESLPPPMFNFQEKVDESHQENSGEILVRGNE